MTRFLRAAVALALLLAGPVRAAPLFSAAEAAVPSLGAGAAAARIPALLADPGPSLTMLPLAARIAYPGAADALAPLRAAPLLEVGSGPRALLSHRMAADMGFAPENLHAVDPRWTGEAPAAAPAENFRAVGAEALPAEWDGRFRHVISFFTFNPEIVDGSTHGMGRGIDVEKAAARMAAVLESGGRLLVVTGAANGLDAEAEAAFGRRLRLRVRHGDSVHVFEKP